MWVADAAMRRLHLRTSGPGLVDRGPFVDPEQRGTLQAGKVHKCQRMSGITGPFARRHWLDGDRLVAIVGDRRRLVREHDGHLYVP